MKNRRKQFPFMGIRILAIVVILNISMLPITRPGIAQVTDASSRTSDVSSNISEKAKHSSVEVASKLSRPAVSVPVKEMTDLEKGAWKAVKTISSTAGSTLGASAGVVVVPSAITAAVGALGISTAGTGFVAGVLIPASPVIGKIVGSAVGAGLFSGLVATAYEIRMQEFRSNPKKAGAIAKDVLKTAWTEAMIAPLTLGLGGGAATAAGEGIKAVAIETAKKASIRFAGDAVIQVFTSALTKPYSNPEAFQDPYLTDTEADSLGQTATVSQETKFDPDAPLSDEEIYAETQNHSITKEITVSSNPTETSAEDDTTFGFSPAIEKAARIGILSGPIVAAVSYLPGDICGACSLRFSVALYLSKSF